MQSLPRGPIFRDDSSSTSPDTADNYRHEIGVWRAAAREEAFRTAQLNGELDRIGQYIRFLSGKQWHSRRARYKSKFFINKVGKARIDTLSHLTDTKPTINIEYTRDDLKEQSEIIKKVMAYEWLNEDMDLSLISAVDIALTGTAFWKIGAASPGSMQVVPCGPDSVLPIQPGLHIQKSTAVMYRTWKSLLNVKRRFPFAATQLDREATSSPVASNLSYGRPSHLPQYVWQALAPQMKRLMGTKISMEDSNLGFFRSVEWQEFYVEDYSTNDSSQSVLMRDPYLSLSRHNWWYWVKPGERLYPRKRLIVYGGKQMVYDGPAPFFHGLYPFATLRLNPVFWSFWGLSMYRDLMPINIAQNEIVAGMLDMIKQALNRTVIATKRAQIPDAAWREFYPDIPGEKLMLGGNADTQRDLRYMDPAQIPSYVLQLLTGFLNPEFDKMSGLIDIATLGGKRQVPGGDTIEQMRDTMQAGIRLESRYIEVFLRDAGVQSVSNILQFYTLKRKLQLLGEDGLTFEDFNFNPGVWSSGISTSQENRFDYWKQFPFKIVPGSLHSGARDRDKQVAVQLAAMGKLPTRKLLEILDIPDTEADEIMTQLAEEAAAGMSQESSGPRLTRGQRNAKVT